VQVRSERTESRTAALPEQLDVESRGWVDGLRAEGVERARALERLHELLLRAAYAEAHRRRHLYPEIGGAELDDLCSQAAGDAVLAVTSKLDGYRGASRFTTWAYAFAIFEVSVKLRRHAWHRGRIPTADDDATWDRFAEGTHTAQSRVESAELLRALRRAVAEELTPRQREVFVAVALNEVQIDVVAGQLHSSRGAVYKVLHDARAKLRRRLEREGHLEEEQTR
jgi:RNA polymerase sigma-70 factor, ECF subfamily